jgi:quercetin dioxygenase-like cupin family protein
MRAKVQKASDAKLQPVPRARGAKMAVLIGEDDGAPNFAKRRFILEAGGRIPRHFHPDIEHEQFIVRGSMSLGLGDDFEEVAEGDVVFIPAGVEHWYENTSGAPCEFLCSVPITEDYETVWLEDPPTGAYDA